jgi:hypothetical protein
VRKIGAELGYDTHVSQSPVKAHFFNFRYVKQAAK